MHEIAVHVMYGMVWAEFFLFIFVASMGGVRLESVRRGRISEAL